nr:coiled-coil domain-containing protein 190 isoform X1 [Manis javanica]
MEKPTAGASLYKCFDWERKNAKQAETRLGQRLQRLEAVRLQRAKLLAREQKQLQEDLTRLQQADIIKKKLSSYFGNGNQKRPEDALMFSPRGGQTHRAPQAREVRAPVTVRTQEVHKAKSQVPRFHHTGLKDPTTNKGKSIPPNDRTSPFTGEKPQAQETDSINPPTGKDPSQGVSVLCQDQVSANTPDQGPSCRPRGESRAGHAAESRSNDTDLKPDLSPAECAGNFNGDSTRSTYLELFEKAKNAHYLRHRVPPESERLLSIGEIFGHEESLQPRAGAECENRVAS